jgi:tetratricopeptide (TPR) repeat protein
MYHEATAANLRAVASDRDYLVQCHAQGLYPVAYASHNLHFLWAAATQEGRSALAIETAEKIAARLEGEYESELRGETAGSAQHFWITPLYARVRFGRWGEVLAVPEPPSDFHYPRGVWHYAQGLALTRKGRLEEARGHLEELTAVSAEPALEGMTFWDMNLLTDLLGVARHVLAGEIAAGSGDFETAIRELEAGVAAEDALNYDDPPDWHHPVRQVLGAVLLAAGRPADAERVYREDLERQPHNGWSLYGLHASLEARGETEEAAAAAERFAEAWRHADVELTSSRL